MTRWPNFPLLAPLLGLLCLLFSPSAESQNQQPVGGLVVGTVVDSATGELIPGVRVTRIELGGSGRQIETISDDRGRFAFAGVETGRWRIVGELSGYETGANDRRRPNGPDRPLDIATGSRATVVIRMFRSSGSLCGTVVDEVNQLAVGINVNAAALYGTTGDGGVYGIWPAAATTDDMGRFCLRLPPRDYAVVVPPETVTTLRSDQIVKVNAGGNAVLQPPVQRPSTPFLSIDGFDVFFGSQNRIGLVAPTSSSARLDSVYDVAVYPQGSLAMNRVVGGQVTSVGEVVLRRTSAHRVSGRLIGPAGPVPDANVRVVPKAFAASTEGSMDIAASRTDSAGSFTMFGIPAGAFVVRASGGSVGTNWAETAISVGDSDMADVTIEIRRGVRAQGRVVFAGSTPVTDEMRSRVAVSLVSVDTQIRGAAGAKLAADGTFQTADYPPGRYLVSVTAPAGWVLVSAIHERQDIALSPINLPPEASVDVVVTLTDRTATLTGRVLTPVGTADAEAAVLLFPAAFHFRLGFGSPAPLFREAKVASDGSFELRMLPPGEYFVIAVDDAAADGWRAASEVPRLSAAAERIRLQPGDQLMKEMRTRTVRRTP